MKTTSREERKRERVIREGLEAKGQRRKCKEEKKRERKRDRRSLKQKGEEKKVVKLYSNERGKRERERGVIM